MRRNQQQIEELRANIKNIQGFDKERLIKRQEWGTITLEEARHEFDLIYDVIDYLNVLPVESLPADIVTIINGAIRTIINEFNQINKFSVEVDNPSGRKNEFISNIQSYSDALNKNASMWIPFLAYQKGDITKNINELTTTLRKAEELTSTALADITDKSKEMNDIISKAREAAASAGAAIFTKAFENERDNLKKEAKKWLWATGLSAFAAIVGAFGFWWHSMPGMDSGLVWQQVTSKIILLGVLVTATLWCGKIYRALMHQATVYQHKALSIQTIQAFHASVQDPAMKDTVVVEASRAIFGSSITGYIDGKEQGEGSLKVLEIAKQIIPKG